MLERYYSVMDQRLKAFRSIETFMKIVPESVTGPSISMEMVMKVLEILSKAGPKNGVEIGCQMKR